MFYVTFIKSVKPLDIFNEMSRQIVAQYHYFWLMAGHFPAVLAQQN